MIFGYSQGDLVGKLYQNVMTTSGNMTQSQFVSYTVGCFNNCPSFSSVSNIDDGTVYLVVGDGLGNDTYYRIDVRFKIEQITVFPNILNILFNFDSATILTYGNLDKTGGYAIKTWRFLEREPSTIASINNATWTIHRSAFDGKNTLYSIDQYSSVLTIWDYSRKQVSHLQLQVPSGIWVYNLVDLKYSTGTRQLYGLDRNCSVWQVDVFRGNCTKFISPNWQRQSVLVGGIQMVIDDSAFMMYFVGYNNGSYVLATVDLFRISLHQTPLSNAGTDLQWLGMALIEPRITG